MLRALWILHCNDVFVLLKEVRQYRNLVCFFRLITKSIYVCTNINYVLATSAKTIMGSCTTQANAMDTFVHVRLQSNITVREKVAIYSNIRLQHLFFVNCTAIIVYVFMVYNQTRHAIKRPSTS